MNIVEKSKIWLSLSASAIIIGIIAMIVFGLPLGIDFTGGSLLEIKSQQPINNEQISKAYQDNQTETERITPLKNGGAIIRSKTIDETTKNKIVENLAKTTGQEVTKERFETIGPTLSKNLKKNAIWSVGVASLAIVIYVAIAFARLPEELSSWRFGFVAVGTLLHDILVTLGIWAIFASFLGFEIDSLLITSLLTVMGFSVHDTIVVFDRIRENVNKQTNKNFIQTVNASIAQTIMRSLNTSVTLVLALLALLVLGGASLRSFVLILLIGTIVGTYSSIFIASPLLVIWQNAQTKVK